MIVLDISTVAIAFELHWPSRTHYFDAIKPVRGYTLAPRTQGKARLGVQLLYFMRIANRGRRYTFDAVTVDYHVGDREHRTVIRNGLKACIFPQGVKPDIKRCPKPSTRLTCSPVVLTGQAAWVRWSCPSLQVAATSSGVL
jgi:hypothetical protein